MHHHGGPLSFVYDVRGLGVLHSLFLAYMLFMAASYIVAGKHRHIIWDLLALTAVSALPRLWFFQKTSLRTAHFFIVLYPPDSYFNYPGSLTSIVTGIYNMSDGYWDRKEIAWCVLLIVGILTPAVFYLLALRLSAQRKLAWTMGLLLALNPSHVMFSGPYDLFIVSVFFEVLSHLLLLVFFQTKRFVFFGGFLMASYLFYQARAENSIVFGLHSLCLLYALWRLPVNKALLSAGCAIYFTMNGIFQYDWYQSRVYEVHVVANLWKAPWKLLETLKDPSWNHLIDFHWCPPYILVLLFIGLWRILFNRSIVHIYPIVIFATFLAVYSDIRCNTIHGNARYFLNIVPAIFLVASEAMVWIYSRWERFFPLVVVIIVGTFVMYLPQLANNRYIMQYEWAFYWNDVRHTATGGGKFWSYSPQESHWDQYVNKARDSGALDPAAADDILRQSEWIENEFEETHLFEGLENVIHDPAKIRPEDYVFLGSRCYQFVVAGDHMLPECEAQLSDPRNEILLKNVYPARVFHTVAPWYLSGAYKNFTTTTFYLLRRKAG